jgi:predicted protein tyrosine phosphatase
MIQIHPNLFVGSEVDFESQVRHEVGWRVVHACKEPYHRQALRYNHRGAPSDNPEYLVAQRGDQLMLNIIDVDDPAFIHKEIIDAALDFIEESLIAEMRVLVHCNTGKSRGPSIGMLYLLSRCEALPVSSFQDAELAFQKLYPDYRPAAGIRGFLKIHFDAYRRKSA